MISQADVETVRLRMEVCGSWAEALEALGQHGRRAGMDVEVEIIGASIATIRDGKLARWEDFADRATALEAAGLRDPC